MVEDMNDIAIDLMLNWNACEVENGCVYERYTYLARLRSSSKSVH